MRIWSLSPMYLDQKGLVAQWREGLLARKVLLGETKGYKNHPQLKRFKEAFLPIAELDNYLNFIVEEANCRGYNFNASKLAPTPIEYTFCNPLTVTTGQLEYEWNWLSKKLEKRNPKKLKENIELRNKYGLYANHSFDVIEGDIEPWEVVK